MFDEAAGLPGEVCRNGLRWARTAFAPGRGRPDWKRIHPQRQRRCQQRLLCAVCTRPADRDGEGYLWLLGALPDGRLPEGELTAEPPTCPDCVSVATERCGHLRRGGWITCRVRAPLAYGVAGTLYTPGRVGEPAVEVGEVKDLSYEDPRAPWVLARQMLRRLTGCTLVAAGAPLALPNASLISFPMPELPCDCV
ncbi:hypothetical protein [Streptacidiphilus sp. MAP5-52]|uniref:hypothetical protein n=1 Tax=Streptacidiphilus sp. MAP5-52 TaxID=3156267 RepID=UPI003519C035